MRHTGENVVRIEAEALRALADRIGGPMAEAFQRAVELMYCCAGRVVVTGMGKSGLIARKIAATLSSTGTPALYLHPVEALHGDLGMVVRGDVVLALSASGETEEILALLATIKRLRVPLIAMTGDEICRGSHPSKSTKGGAPHSFLIPELKQIVLKASGDSLQESFAENHQLFADGEADAAREHIVIEPHDFFEQAAIDGDQHPQRGLAVFGNERDQLFGGTVIFKSALSLQFEQRAQARGIWISCDIRRHHRKLIQVFLRQINPAHGSVFFYIANDVCQLKGESDALG
jgi:hypothetical protein